MRVPAHVLTDISHWISFKVGIVDSFQALNLGALSVSLKQSVTLARSPLDMFIARSDMADHVGCGHLTAVCISI